MVAIFTYQLTYYFWAYMECEEIKGDTRGEDMFRPDYFFEQRRNGVLEADRE